MICIPAYRSPRALENLRIFQSGFDLQSVDVDSPDPFHHVKILGMTKRLMTVSATANSALGVEASCVDYQRVAVPATNRISHPADTGLMRAYVQRNSAKQMHVFIVNDDVIGVLNDLK